MTNPIGGFDFIHQFLKPELILTRSLIHPTKHSWFHYCYKFIHTVPMALQDTPGLLWSSRPKLANLSSLKHQTTLFWPFPRRAIFSQLSSWLRLELQALLTEKSLDPSRALPPAPPPLPLFSFMFFKILSVLDHLSEYIELYVVYTIRHGRRLNIFVGGHVPPTFEKKLFLVILLYSLI